MINIRVQSEAFNSAAEGENLRSGNLDIGATVAFTGYVRSEENSLTSMTLEHYPGMTEKQLDKIAAQAEERWPLDGLTIIHRYGKLLPGDPIVLVIAASRHRAHAFSAASFVMDFLKSEAPFWKKEDGKDGTKWIAAKDSDLNALKHWD